MSTSVTVQNKIKLLQEEAEKELSKKLNRMDIKLNNDHTLILDVLVLTPEICHPLALACELVNGNIEKKYRDALEEIIITQSIQCDGNHQGDYACDLHKTIAEEALK